MDDHTTEPQLKLCPVCVQSYPATTEYFYADKNVKSGLGTYCKTCRRRKSKEQYEADPQGAYQKARERIARNPEKNREYKRRDVEKNQARRFERNMRSAPSEKRCVQCGEVKPISEFHIQRGSPGGHKYECRVCCSIAKPKEVLPDGLKRCYTCKQVLPKDHDHFGISKHEKDGFNGRCRQCVRRRNKELYNENPTVWKRSSAKYRHNHREEINRRHREANKNLTPEQLARKRSSWRRYHARHKDRCRERTRRWRVANADYLREKGREYRRKNADKLKEYNRRYAEQNRERRAFLQRRRTHRIRSIGGTYTREDIELIRKAQGNRCWYCGVDLAETGEHIDHFIPVSKGGTNDSGNLRLACPTCNISKHNHDPHEWSGRLL